MLRVLHLTSTLSCNKQQIRLLTGLNVDGKTRNITRFAAMLQNKLHVFAARFTEALDGTVNRIIHYPVNKFKGGPPGGGGGTAIYGLYGYVPL